MRKLRIRRPSAALVVSCLALLVALGGTSYATGLTVPRNSVGTPQLKRGAVGTLQLKRGAVGTLQLKRNAVKSARLAPDTVRTAHVVNGSLLAADFKAGQLPKGDKGEKGVKGEKGDPGPAGISGYQRVERVFPTENITNPKVVRVVCPDGKHVLGGGFVVSGSPGTIAVTESRAISDNTWWVVAWQLQLPPLGAAWGVSAYATCANVDE